MALARKKSSSGSTIVVECDSGVAVGDWVYLDGGNIAQKGLADSLSKSHLLGVVNSKPSTTSAKIVLNGATSAIFSSLDVTKDYFLSPVTPGAMVLDSGLPSTPNTVILLLGRPISATRFSVEIGMRVLRS